MFNRRSVGAPQQATIALVDWSHLIEDFLDNIGVSFEAFCDELTGGWMFGYIDALQLSGVRTVLFCVSARVNAPQRYSHRPTGATICVLPAPCSYRVTRRSILNPYAMTVDEAAADARGLRRPVRVVMKALAPYQATPLRLLARELRRERCVAVLCQEYEHARFDMCVLLGKLLRLPVFGTFQGGNWQLSKLERPLRPATLRACAGLIVASQSEIARLIARYDLPPAKIARIFNPIDLAPWQATDRPAARAALGIPLGARVVVWHGRVLIHRKGLDVLLAAWDQICRARPGEDTRLLLVGSGNDAMELRDQLAARQLPGLTWIDAYLNDRAALYRYLAAADIYAFPSRHEGFPVAPIEAMAHGLPIVAADAPGMADILEGGEASGGLSVPRGDAQALAAALGRLLDDPEQSRELGIRARRRVEHAFAPAVVGAQLRAFLIDRSRVYGPIERPG